MHKSLQKILQGYRVFRKKYADGNRSIMKTLSHQGQSPKVMVIACSDSRVDPALILQCDPGDLFVVRNVANIVPPYEKDDMHHGTSAALEFAICSLEVSHLVLLGHSQCGGIQTLLQQAKVAQDDFISNWVSLVKMDDSLDSPADDYAKKALHKSHQNCLTFPWIAQRVSSGKLLIHLWFFDIKSGQIQSYSPALSSFEPLDQQD
jgi:carbonic anhydrase